MGKRFGILLTVLLISFSLNGCKLNNTIDLDAGQREHVENITKMAVSSEVYSKYGIMPGITIDSIAVYNGRQDFYSINFTTKGSYTVADDSGTLYSGTFKVKGYSLAHGSGWDSCEITDAKNGADKLPEQSHPTPLEEAVGETPEVTTIETTVETTVLTLQSSEMISLSSQFEKDGYNIMVEDPSQQFEKCYGALEYFRAFNNDSFYEVFLYDDQDAAEYARSMMYGEGSDRIQSEGASSEIIDGKILVVEHIR